MNNQNLDNLRHSCAHLLAKAVLELWPGTHNAIGPAIENGFYQDFDMGDVKISEADIPKIEQKMRDILPLWKQFSFKEVSLEEAKKLFKHNPYKIELAQEFATEGKKLMTNNPGNFLDLCKMGHVDNPAKELQHFKLLSIAGAYWRGDEKNTMLTRIYGTAFPTQKELDHHLWQLEEAKKRDHKKLGPKLGLFYFSDLVGSGLPLYTPKGALIRRLLQNHVSELQQSIGYAEVWTPQLTKAELFKVSGHYEKYKADMFRVVSNYSAEEFYLKPMNCPNHCVLFGSQPRSYKDLPIRFSDFANLFRDEKPGELSGLIRLRCFSQDDGHCFCREDQIEKEFTNVLGVIRDALKPFSMNYWIRLSLWDPQQKDKYLGEPAVWEKAQQILKHILVSRHIEHKKAVGEAAIYGPKMDFMVVDSLGREWQISTIQLDLIMAQRFGLSYTDQNGKPQTPVMIHRAILGSPERFLGLLLEHYAGALPVWLSPVQVAILPISEKHASYASKVSNQLQSAHIRFELDERSESLPKRIRDAELQKVPYMLIVGDHEAKNNSVSVRARGEKDLGSMSLEKFISLISQEISSKATTTTSKLSEETTS